MPIAGADAVTEKAVTEPTVPAGEPAAHAAAPLVSVIIPSYNHARFVGACLDSVAGESYRRVEVLVVDDGSSDGSASAVRRWRRGNVGRFERFELHEQENRGVTGTLNRLVGMARGEYIALLASDDLLVAGGLAARVRALEAHAEWLAVFGDSLVIDSGGEVLAQSALVHLGADPDVLRVPELVAGELIMRWAMPGPVFMARRAAYDATRGVGLYDESLTIEDRDFYLRLAARRAIGHVEATVGAYRVHGGGSASGDAARRRALASLARIDRRHAAAFPGFYGLALRVSARRHDYGARGPARTLMERVPRKLVSCLWDALIWLYRLRTCSRWLTRSRRPGRGREDVPRGARRR